MPVRFAKGDGRIPRGGGASVPRTGGRRGRACTLGPRRLEEEAIWIEACRRRWAARIDELDDVPLEVTRMKNPTTVERRSDRELVVTRAFDEPARTVYEAWTRPELFTRWWVPRSFGLDLLSCDMDVRVGGKYRLVFRVGASDSMAFFGTYVEVVPHSRLAWTNEEGGEGGAVTTVTFVEGGGRTVVVMSDLHPSKDALDAAIASGSTSGLGETFDQLGALLGTLSAGGA